MSVQQKKVVLNNPEGGNVVAWNKVIDSQYKVNYELSSGYVLEALEADWISIEKDADGGFFLSWFWVSTWLEVYRPDIKVLRAYVGDRLVAIGLITIESETRHALVRSRVARIHQTGNASRDQIWIEHNGLLINREYQQSVDVSWVKYLESEISGWDEIKIAAIRESRAAIVANSPTLLRSDLWETHCYGVDLIQLRQNQSTYLASLSRNTRHQINRSLRLFGSSGEVSLTRAETSELAKQFFMEASEHHKKRWGIDAGQSGFANNDFVKFHLRLIEKGVEQGLVDLIQIRYGRRAKSYFYNFIYGNTVYFYLSGVPQLDEGKLKPGLVGHSMCIQRYLDNGLDFYDFMGGDERYKASLGKIYDGMVSFSLQKPLLKFKLEAKAKKYKAFFTG